jgi:hypothetical protein
MRVHAQEGEEIMRTLLKRFLRGHGGTVGLLLALAAIPLFALAGGVIDFVYVQNERSRLQNAMDAAVLAAMHRQGDDEEVIRQTMIDYLRANYKPAPRVRVDYDSLDVSLTDEGGSVRLKARIKAEASMTFWALVGVRTHTIWIMAEATQGVAGLEVALVLDNTLSMSWQEWSASRDAVVVKIDELKESTHQLLRKLHELGTGANVSLVKAALVPYATNVRLDPATTGRPDWLDLSCCNSGWEGYVGFRPPPLDILDADYDTSPIPAIPRGFRIDGYLVDDLNLQPLVPLVDVTDEQNLQMLQQQVDRMSPTGWTYIPAGLVWGWRLLSATEPFTEGLPDDEARAENVRKVIILLTDGVNTCRAGNDGMADCRHEWTGPGQHSPDADARLLSLCGNIRKAGIHIISIVYAVEDDSIRDLMRSCSNAGYYEPMVGDLINVFDDIARKLARLHLSQ